MTSPQAFFATVPRNIEGLLARELESLGARNVRETQAGVSFEGPQEVAYRAVLWSRLANAVLLPIKRFAAPNPDALYRGVMSIDWDAHFGVDDTFAVTFTSSRSAITHTQFGAQRVKDAIVDQFRQGYGRRPSVDLVVPGVRINCHLDKDEATVSIDLSGESLHRRGYRMDAGEAPLKENVAAAVLLRAGWPAIAKSGGALVDPMCGAGTLVIEGAMMAADIAPGLARRYFGLTGWRQFDAKLWAGLVDEAQQRRRKGLDALDAMGPMLGSDIDPKVLRQARDNASRAGLGTRLAFERREMRELRPEHAPRVAHGLIVANPPYGERMGSMFEALNLHRDFGQMLKAHFGGWKASIITGSDELGFAVKLRANKRYPMFNGRMECVLLNFDIMQRPAASGHEGTP